MGNGLEVGSGTNRVCLNNTHVERILGLPIGTLDNELGNDPAVAPLVKIIKMYPWMLEVADKGFDPKVARETLLSQAFDEVSYKDCKKELDKRMTTPVAPAVREQEMVCHPKHYAGGGIEVIDAIEAWKLGFNLGNTVKYVARADHKGKKLEDLKKARWYLDREISRLEKEQF